ncbi:ABC transporter substrate-binding protein [Treponema phagedenis]|uniref:ABC transporter substrate-binding protein n=1 Tax=Treponema phagedenis TaxID=162 RepID=UPI003CC8158A
MVVLAVISAAGLYFTSCTKAAEKKTITLNYWTHEDPTRNKLEERLITEFEAQNPDIKIVRTTHSSDKLIELIQTAFAANSGPDIFTQPIENGYAYIANNRVAPMNPQAAGYKDLQAVYDAYDLDILDSVSKDGNIYALPLEVVNWCIYINKRIFRDAGLDPEKDYPKTWEDMMHVSERIVLRDGDIITRRGFDFRYPFYLVAVVPMVEQLGGKLISDDGKTAIIGDAAWRQLLTFMQQWGPSGKNLGSPTYKNARKIFDNDNNEIAMTHSGLYQEARIKADNPEFYNSNDWMVIPFPVFEHALNNVASCYYGQFLMVNGDIEAANQEAAWKFLGFLLSHEQEYLTEGGSLMQPTKTLLESETLKNMPYSDVFINDMHRSHMVYYGANSAELQMAIRSAVESVMLAGVSPEKALATLKATAQEILDEENQ